MAKIGQPHRGLLVGFSVLFVHGLPFTCTRIDIYIYTYYIYIYIYVTYIICIHRSIVIKLIID